MTFRKTKSLTMIGSLLIVLSIACRLFSGIDPGVAAAFTGNPDFGVIATHKNGESLVVMTDSENGEVDEVTGAIWSSPEREAVVVHKGNNGLPINAVIGDFLILFSNYGADSVDIAIIGSDGSTTIARNVKFDPALLSAITSHAPGKSTSHLAAPHLQSGLTLEDVVLVGAGTVHVAACIISSAAAASNLAFFEIAGVACTSAILVVRAINAGEAPYSDFTDWLSYAEDEVDKVLELVQSQQVQDSLSELSDFLLMSGCDPGWYLATDGLCHLDSSCDPGWYLATNGYCYRKSACDPGYFLATDGLCYLISGDGPVLQPNSGCDPGYYLATDGYCYPVSGDGPVLQPNSSCDPGWYLATDGLCYPESGCDPGYYPATDGLCYPESGCDPGWYLATDGLCYPESGCPAGYYPATDGLCYPESPCPAGYYLATDGLCYSETPSCPAGYYLATDGLCYPESGCPAGYYLATDGLCYPY
jgi:hypothetical protein